MHRIVHFLNLHQTALKYKYIQITYKVIVVNEMFLPNDINHRYNTRYGNQLKIPKHNTNLFKQNIKAVLNGEIGID